MDITQLCLCHIYKIINVLILMHTKKNCWGGGAGKGKKFSQGGDTGHVVIDIPLRRYN